MSKKPTGFSLDPDVVEGIRDLAAKDERTASSYVNIILTKHLKREGYKFNTKRKKKLKRRK